MISEKGLRLAIHDTLLQEDRRTHNRLAERLRAENAEMYRIQRSMASLAKEMLLVQRRMAATADLIAIEEMEKAA